MRYVVLLIGVMMWLEIAAAQKNYADENSKSLENFSPKFYTSIAEEKKDDNMICSPLSLWTILTMMSAGAQGKTEEVIREALSLPPYNKNAEIKRGQALIHTLKEYPGVILRTANKIFLGTHFEPKNEFREVTQQGFESQVENVDFSRSSEAARKINEWCNSTTSGTIPKLFDSDAFTSDSMMVLANVVYFKGSWANKFDPADTRNRTFHINDKQTVSVPTMFKNASYFYAIYSELDALAIAIPYATDNVGKTMYMIIVLPNKINGLSRVEQNLDKLDWAEIFSEEQAPVNLWMPKFTIESEFNLEPSLEKLGMGEMFDQTRANFSGISDIPLEVSKIVQKAFIEVNEEGTESSAATGEEFANRMSRPRTRDIDVNHPCLIAIVAESLDGLQQYLPIFIGRYTGQNSIESNSNSRDAVVERSDDSLSLIIGGPSKDSTPKEKSSDSLPTSASTHDYSGTKEYMRIKQEMLDFYSSMIQKWQKSIKSISAGYIK